MVDAEKTVAAVGKAAKFIGYLAFVYIAIFALYTLINFRWIKGGLLNTGIDESTATLLAIAVVLVAIAVPVFSAIRILALRGRLLDYAAVMVLPLISWGVKQSSGNFDQEGQAMQYCADRPDGTSFCLDHDGFDPETGIKLQAITTGAAENEFRRQKGLAPQRISEPFDKIVFFDSIDGRPIVWVWPTSDGCFEAFDNKGIHPVEGGELIAVTPKLVAGMRGCLDRRDQERQRAIRVAAEKKANDAKLAQDKRESAARELARKKRELARKNQLAEQLAEQQAAARRQAEWTDFDARISVEPGADWAVEPFWRESLSGKRVTISYSDTRRIDAIDVGARLRSLGAIVSHVQTTSSNERASEIRYSYAFFDAANALRAAGVQVVRMELISAEKATGSIDVVLH